MSLWELLWVVTIVASIVALGAPGFERFLLDSRRTADINAFVLAIQLARSEAAKRGVPVVLCKTGDRRECGGRETRLDAGWMVFVAEGSNESRARGAENELLYFHTPRSEGPIHANRRIFEFRPAGWRSTNGTVTFCDRRGEAAARAVIVSYTGRPRIAERGPGGRRLDCGDSP